MNTHILSAFLAGVTTCASAQGYIYLDNNSNTSTSPTTTANGLFWLSTGGTPTLLNQDFNAAFYGGDSSNLSIIAIFLLSNGTATHDNGLGPGRFTDPTGKLYPVPGSSFSAYFQIQAWTGNFNSYAEALSGGAFAAQGPVFSNVVSAPPAAPPDLVGMPALVLAVPEPSTFVLVGLGCLCVLPGCRRRPGPA